MEIYQLQSFVAVAEEGFLTRAAKRLCLTQPAVSMQLKTLEDELGVRLFDRTNYGMKITREGSRLLTRARKVLAAVNEFEDLARSFRRDVSGTARIGLCTDLAFLRVVELTTRMHQDFPGIELHILQSMSETVLEQVRSGEMEGGFRFGELPALRDVGGIKLAEFQLLVVGPTAWKVRLDSAPDWNALMEFPWIWLISSCPYCRIAEHKLHSMGLPSKPPEATIVDHEDAITAFVAAGKGISLMREDEARDAEKQGKLVVWEKDSLSTQVNFIYKKKRVDSPINQALIECVNHVWQHTACCSDC